MGGGDVQSMQAFQDFAVLRSFFPSPPDDRISSSCLDSDFFALSNVEFPSGAQRLQSVRSVFIRSSEVFSLPVFTSAPLRSRDEIWRPQWEQSCRSSGLLRLPLARYHRFGERPALTHTQRFVLFDHVARPLCCILCRAGKRRVR